jgi:alanine racemase
VTPLVSATIDTAALRHNLAVVRKHAPNSRVMAVVKANAYGHGLVTVARALQSADAFAVARVDEGLALRAAGIKGSVVLLEGVFDAEQLKAAADAQFELVIHTPEQIELLRSMPHPHRFQVWLKLDSGMNRLGFKGGAFRAAHAALSALRSVATPVNLFTHLASADEPKVSTTKQQLQVFEQATRDLPGHRAIENSAAILAFPEAHADWVRPGLLLYGVSPFADSLGADFGLKPVMTLHSQIIAVKHLDVGEHVGYGGNWIATQPTDIAIAAVGYGDGYPRNLPSESPVLVNGERVGLTGRVSMDMIAVDITDLKARPKLGDPVVLWGAGLPVEEVARIAQTIPYELLCGISQRVAVSVV